MNSPVVERPRIIDVQRLKVIHQTTYHYAAPVDVAHHLAALRLAKLPFQRIEQQDLMIAPLPASHGRWIDGYGNARDFFSITGSHAVLNVCSSGLVERAVPAVPTRGCDWEDLRDSLHFRVGVPYDAAAEFALPSPYVALHPELAAFAAPSFPVGRDILEAVLDLMRRVHEHFTFDPAGTDVETSALDAFKLAHGVCQDYAHVMIGALRAIGLAARYVSGYLLTNPPPGQPRLIGADASHAWVSVYCGAGSGGESGWLELDPTNDVIVGSKHVTVAYGRDYGDVTPLRGVLQGGGAHTLEVAVTVMPMEDDT